MKVNTQMINKVLEVGIYENEEGVIYISHKNEIIRSDKEHIYVTPVTLNNILSMLKNHEEGTIDDWKGRIILVNVF